MIRISTTQKCIFESMIIVFWISGCGYQEQKASLLTTQSTPTTSITTPSKPEISYITLNELEHIISNRNGKALFVNYWATWCDPCIKEIPFIVELQKEFETQVDFMLISADYVTGTAHDVPELLHNFSIRFPSKILNVDDQNQMINAIDSEWSGALPATIIYNSKGEKSIRIFKSETKEGFKKAIEQVISN